MSLIVGFGVVAGLVTWVTKVADTRGRSALGWAVIALGLALFGMWLGWFAVVGALTTRSDELLLVAMLAPPALSAAAACGVVFVLKRLPIKTSSRARWPVHDMTPGTGGITGEVALVPGAIELRLATTRAIPIGALRGARSDGECVRIAWDAGDAHVDLLLLPCGTPDTPAGRQQQSRVIAARVQRHIARGAVAALPAAKLLP